MLTVCKHSDSFFATANILLVVNTEIKNADFKFDECNREAWTDATLSVHKEIFGRFVSTAGLWKQ